MWEDYKLEDILVTRAQLWYKAHKQHIDNYVKDEKLSIPPTEPYDKRQPEVWKPIHWKWFLNNYRQSLR